MADFGQFADLRTGADYRQAAAQARAFYGDMPMSIDTPCGARAHLDMDGFGYRCGSCLAVVGSVGCPCSSGDT